MSKKNFTSGGWSAPDWSGSATGGIVRECCGKTDAELMQSILEGEDCGRVDITMAEVHKRLKKQRKRVLLVNGIRYARRLSQCQRCLHYNGEYPRWRELFPFEGGKIK